MRSTATAERGIFDVYSHWLLNVSYPYSNCTFAQMIRYHTLTQIIRIIPLVRAPNPVTENEIDSREEKNWESLVGNEFYSH